MITWLRHYEFIVRAARSPTFLWSFEPDTVKYLTSVKWRAAIWQSNKDISSRRNKRRSISNQCKRQHTIHKAVARPVSKHQRRSLAHITSYPDEESIFYEQNPRRRKTRPIQTTCNGSQWRIICESNISVQQRSIGRHLASIAFPPRINCVRNKIRKTIVSVANQVLFAPSVACMRAHLHSRWSISQKRWYLSDSDHKGIMYAYQNVMYIMYRVNRRH